MDDQLDDAGEFTANAAIDAAIGLQTGTLGRTSGELAEGAEKLGKAGSGRGRWKKRRTTLLLRGVNKRSNGPGPYGRQPVSFIPIKRDAGIPSHHIRRHRKKSP